MITPFDVQVAIERVVLYRVEDTDTIVCALVLHNGCVVVGEAHGDPSMVFDAAAITREARHDAEVKVALFLAFMARSKVKSKELTTS